MDKNNLKLRNIFSLVESAYRWPLENLTDVLPNIPVQPLSASDAAPLLQAMSGNEVPAEWRGQLQNTTYRFGGQFTGSRSGWYVYLLQFIILFL